MNFVDEHDRAASRRAADLLGVPHDVPDFFDAREDGAERDKPRLRRIRNDPRERRLPGAWWTPEDDRLEQVPLDRLAERLAGREEIALSDELVEGAGAHALGEGCLRRSGGGFIREERTHLCRRTS